MTVLQPLLIGDGANFVHVAPPQYLIFNQLQRGIHFFPLQAEHSFPKENARLSRVVCNLTTGASIVSEYDITNQIT